MRRFALVALVALLVPLVAEAQIGTRGYQLRFNMRGNFTSPQGGLFGSTAGLPQLGPWYLYWPLEAHFQTPAPPAYPYWPQGGGAQAYPAPGAYQGVPPGAVPNVYVPPGPANFHAPQIQQAGYYYPPPAYWYGR